MRGIFWQGWASAMLFASDVWVLGRCGRAENGAVKLSLRWHCAIPSEYTRAPRLINCSIRKIIPLGPTPFTVLAPAGGLRVKSGSLGSRARKYKQTSRGQTQTSSVGSLSLGNAIMQEDAFDPSRPLVRRTRIRPKRWGSRT